MMFVLGVFTPIFSFICMQKGERIGDHNNRINNNNHNINKDNNDKAYIHKNKRFLRFTSFFFHSAVIFFNLSWRLLGRSFMVIYHWEMSHLEACAHENASFSSLNFILPCMQCDTQVNILYHSKRRHSHHHHSLFCLIFFVHFLNVELLPKTSQIITK